jgi:hypothetical protein
LGKAHLDQGRDGGDLWRVVVGNRRMLHAQPHEVLRQLLRAVPQVPVEVVEDGIVIPIKHRLHTNTHGVDGWGLFTLQLIRALHALSS